MRVVLVAVTLVAFTPSSAPAAESLGMPAGWVDLSPGAPEENFARVAGNLAQAARASKATQFAVEPATGDLAPAFFHAVVVAKAMEVSPRELDANAAILLESRKSTDPAARVVGKELVRVRGVEAMRVEVEHAVGGRLFRAIMYQVPLGGRTAFLSYACERSGCERIRGAISEAVAEMRAEDSFPHVFGTPQLIGWGVTVAALVGAAILVSRKRRRQRAEMPD